MIQRRDSSHPTNFLKISSANNTLESDFIDWFGTLSHANCIIGNDFRCGEAFFVSAAPPSFAVTTYTGRFVHPYRRVIRTKLRIVIGSHSLIKSKDC